METPKVGKRRKDLMKRLTAKYPGSKDMITFIAFTVFPHSFKPPLKFLQGLDPEDAKALLEKVCDADHYLITSIVQRNKMEHMKTAYNNWLGNQTTTLSETPSTPFLRSCYEALKLCELVKECVPLPEDESAKSNRESPLRKQALFGDMRRCLRKKK